MHTSNDHLLNSLLDQQDEHAILLIDRESKINAWLPGAARIFGYTADEVLGKSFTMLFTPEDREKEMPQFEIDVVTKDGHAEDDRWMLRKNGGRFWATGILAPIRDDEGKIVAFGKMLRDRTDLKAHLETAIARAETAEQASSTKNTFIATLAHELRTPLGSIANANAILQLVSRDSEELRFACTTIERQLEYSRRLIEDLMDSVRAGTGKIELHKQKLILNAILKLAVDSCQPRLEEEREFSLVIPNAPIMIEGDPGRLQQVFTNLLENAMKYTSRGEAIWVKASVDGDSAVVKIEDTGIGISAEMLPKIFDLFTQAPTEASGKGLGIGLSLVKDLVTLHGGSVQVRSDGPGKGSEFTVQIPLGGPDKLRPNTPQKLQSE